jgi:hypothetical protein
MDIGKLLAALRDERERINAAITAIERLLQVQTSSESPTKRRGRPPGSKNRPSPMFCRTEYAAPHGARDTKN